MTLVKVVRVIEAVKDSMFNRFDLLLFNDILTVFLKQAFSQQKLHKTVLKDGKNNMILDLHSVCHFKDYSFPSQPRFICVQFKMASNLSKVYFFS